MLQPVLLAIISLIILSPAFNKRQDEYGGSILNRSRILFEIIDSIKSNLGNDFPILIKLNYSDLIENGLSFEDSKWLCNSLDKKEIVLSPLWRQA